MDAEVTAKIRQGLEDERQRTAAPAEFPVLPVIPGGRYMDPGFHELERQYLWKKSWLYACHMDELPRPGSYLVWNRAGAPVIIMRNQSDEVVAFYNTCRHRGGPLLREESGTVEGRLVCGYHGWTYNLDGDLVALRDRHDFPGLDMGCYSLARVRCERMGNWVFINEDPDAEPLQDFLQPLPGYLEQFQPHNLRLVESTSHVVECNVKVMLDAFLESYHIATVHPDTVDRFLDHRGTYIELWRNGHSMMINPNRRDDWTDPGTVGLQDIPTVTEIPRTENVAFCFFPGLITPVAATGMPFLTFWPEGIRSTRIDCHWFGPDRVDAEREPLWETRLENFRCILEEDLRFAPRVQQSMETPAFKGATLNFQERRIYHWHEELDRRIGIDRVPPALRIQPVLGKFVEPDQQ